MWSRYIEYGTETFAVLFECPGEAYSKLQPTAAQKRSMLLMQGVASYEVHGTYQVEVSVNVLR